MPIRSTGHRSTGRAHPSGGAARKSARYDDLAGTTGWNSGRNGQLQNALVLDGSFRLIFRVPEYSELSIRTGVWS